jgi:methyl-accepting chemotaxis protein
VWKKIIPFVVVFFLGGICFFFITKGFCDRTNNTLSKSLNDLTVTNTDLTDANKRLQDSNKRLTATVAELREQITRDYSEARKRAEQIEAGLISIGTGITEIDGNIDAVIQKLEEIKQLINLL